MGYEAGNSSIASSGVTRPRLFIARTLNFSQYDSDDSRTILFLVGKRPNWKDVKQSSVAQVLFLSYESSLNANKLTRPLLFGIDFNVQHRFGFGVPWVFGCLVAQFPVNTNSVHSLRSRYNSVEFHEYYFVETAFGWLETSVVGGVGNVTVLPFVRGGVGEFQQQPLSFD
ncbi:hypothetical protein EVAR_101554_1 [Eumeta japonica]|uniref:Uncharacterized protein n=1 Tax=Eumeta variegata TaxID=151549 RepID=A0A4C1SL75_EUMVA|nr:hypothetical protein EVAR_101554_1 [Eumeta japonica]